MFNVGGGELLVIMLIALIVLGPKRLPDAARQVGKVMGDLKKISNGFQQEMHSAFTEADDPTRVASRRNVLAKDEAEIPPAPAEVTPADDEAVSSAVEAVSDRPAAPPKTSAPAGAKTTSPTAERATAADDVVPEADPPSTAA